MLFTSSLRCLSARHHKQRFAGSMCLVKQSLICPIWVNIQRWARWPRLSAPALLPFSWDRAREEGRGLEGERQVGGGPGDRVSTCHIEGALGRQQEARFSLGFAIHLLRAL